MNNKTAIIIVVWNISNLISTQLELVKRYCKDNFDIIVIDNSTNLEIAKQVKSHVDAAGNIYVKTNTGLSTSNSHAFACDYAYKTFKNNYDYMLFLDHDNFPIANFSVKEILGNKVAGGVGQTRNTKTYFWPGCVVFNNTKLDTNMVDFATNVGFSLDTGGNLYRITEKYGNDNCEFFHQKEVKNTLYDKYDYYFYNIIYNQDGTSAFSFMHFINSSNWNNSQYNDERVNSLIQVLKNYTNEQT